MTNAEILAQAKTIVHLGEIGEEGKQARNRRAFPENDRWILPE